MPAFLTSFLDFIIRHAGTAQARVFLYIFSALESIIIPVPVSYTHLTLPTILLV